MITHTLAGWRDAVSTRLITNEDDTRVRSFGIRVY